MTLATSDLKDYHEAADAPMLTDFQIQMSKRYPQVRHYTKNSFRVLLAFSFSQILNHGSLRSGSHRRSPAAALCRLPPHRRYRSKGPLLFPGLPSDLSTYTRFRSQRKRNNNEIPPGNFCGGGGEARIQQFIGDTDDPSPNSDPAKKTAIGTGNQNKSFYTIRPLTDGEKEFGNDESAIPAGFDSAPRIKLIAENERWVGMRVDLWDDEGTDSEGEALGILVKVQYWWKEVLSGEWLQILHDIMYLGSRDGTEGTQGQIVE